MIKYINCSTCTPLRPTLQLFHYGVEYGLLVGAVGKYTDPIVILGYFRSIFSVHVF